MSEDRSEFDAAALVRGQPKKLCRVSRRAALKAIAESAGAAASFTILNNARPSEGWVVAGRMGDSLVQGPVEAAQVPTLKFFSVPQIRAIDALSETIIPADEHSPGSRAAQVSAYIDTILAESDERRKTFWTDGLAAIDKMAEAEYERKYADCSPEEHNTLLRRLSENEEHPQTLEERFFVAIKRATIDGYYTSAIGIHQELEYQGNGALAEFEGCTHEEHGKH